MEFAYTTTTTKTFEDAVSNVQNEVAKAGMRVLINKIVTSLIDNPK